MKKLIILLVLGLVLVSGCAEDSISDEEVAKAIEDYKEQEKKPQQTVRDLLEEDMYRCEKEAECGWVIANCCSENAGAIWLCANENKSIPAVEERCSKGGYGCEQVERPKPTTPCGCVDGECQLQEEMKDDKEILILQTNYSNCNQYLTGGNDSIVQSFKFNFSKLTRAFFFSVLPMRANKNPKSQVILHIRESNITGEDITNLTKNMKDIKDQEWTEWDFPDIDIDKDKTYFFVFECPNCVYLMCVALAGSSCGNTNEIICFYYQKNDVYSNGNYGYKGYETGYSFKPEYDWDLAFKIYGFE